MTELSPAAGAIVLAFDDRYERCGPFDDNWQKPCLAAALRELANQVVPDLLMTMDDGRSCLPLHCSPEEALAATANEKIRRKILAIADELEAHDA